ncbi:Serine/threonine-protein phosphatase with EF-hands 2 [Larimichthys crocea]|uniref:Serine/threonine-protein phosphatase with EF-hands n=1 Tax=Larimichthys crocea TaxID=215358 RepID=A0A6G0I0I8_LARCR|nr:Serine/threonine-protein phosphatase with EF-hands 2 [Larimichthys crocea]
MTEKVTWPAIRAALLIQRWYRQYVARLEMRRRCTWNIFQSIEYAGEQDQIKLYNFFGFLMDHFTPASSERNLICHIFRKNEICRDIDWERYFCYRSIEVPDSYTGPHLTFPMTFCGVSKLVEAFKHKQNGLPSSDKPYVFNGDYVDRGKNSLEILLILFGFLLVYPNDVHLNRGNHEDHIVNLRYGFTKEVLGKYRVHGKKILKLLQKIFSWLPLATVIDQKVLIVHGGISDTTDLDTIGRVDRHKYVSALKAPKHHAVNGSTTQTMNRNREANLPEEGRRRVYSMNHCSSASAYRYNLQHRSLHSQSISSHLNCSVEEELKMRRRMAGFDQSYRKLSQSDSDSDPESGETTETDEHQWKQIVDMLWSDPMAQNGCVPNEVRGGGCYWGPDVTEEVLGRHNLQLLIRSHECKQEGYEFCHNRRVLTIFSASNYYEVGSNRGAYIRMGSDLVPHFIQYQASRTCMELTLRQSVGWTERSALRALREQLFVHKSDLISAFQEFDPHNTGKISLRNWASATEKVLNLGLPWRVLRPQLVNRTQYGMVDYQQWIRELSITEPKLEVSDNSILETMYKNHSNLETIFRIIDTDHSGLISFEEFHQTWKLLSTHLKMEISDKAIADLAQSIDFNKDGSIDINEFMEAFRLVDLSAHS